MRYVLNLSLALIDLASDSLLAFPLLAHARARTRAHARALSPHSYLIASFTLAQRTGSVRAWVDIFVFRFHGRFKTVVSFINGQTRVIVGQVHYE